MARTSYEDKTLVVFLTMDRSGSSFVTNVFQRLGMSLGPFELYGAHPFNKYGHFEAWAIMNLSRAVQQHVLGFPDAMPPARQVLQELVAKGGEWECDIPQPLLEQGVALLQQLLDSGDVSGFKEPHTALLWGYWRQVFAQFPGLRVVPIFILRSPHAIAMSWFAREFLLYRDSLDVTAVRFRQMNVIYDSWSGARPIVRYDPTVMRDDLKDAAEQCGLPWDEAVLPAVYDAECRQNIDAPISHPAQMYYDRLRRIRDPRDVPPAPEQLLQDMELRESVAHHKVWELSGAVGGRDREIGGLKETIASRDGEIARLHEVCACRDGEMAALRETARQLRAQLDRYERNVLLRPLRWARRGLLHALSRFTARKPSPSNSPAK